MPGQSFGGRIRVRISGLLERDNALLLVKIHSSVTGTKVWMPPGGGLTFGERMEDCLKREFKEETGLEVQVDDLVYVNELIEPPFHAVELYYNVKHRGGMLKLGSDPELEDGEQIIEDLRFIPLDRLNDYDVAPAFIKEKYLKFP